ncbi:ribosomal protein L20, putative [Theileria annulata]|uniref:Ribosomal protein L20, putative n=1 Tax=Theileria annulata TaxID=5874 RepID=Q4UE96_THEAN|nr:ribosomal protein L20, putative [Theileria annulata]CAI74593.1 ribosomal protein L20, putative [Theileria annulata]|eukprot:XP_952325.1 ribosomal protein L20, putative [Theileria annulata]
MKIPRDIVFQVVRGFRGRTKGCLKLASVRAAKALNYSFHSRRKRHSQIRAHWISTINRASREWWVIYSRFIGSLSRVNCSLSKKSLFILALNEPVSFKCLVDESKYLLNEVVEKRRDISNI